MRRNAITPQDGGRICKRSGFTLIEVVTAMFVLTTVSGIYIAMLMRGYESTTINRHREQARAVLNSYADRFGRMANGDPLYAPTNGTPTGVGLTWQGQNGTSSGLLITLGGAGDSVQANLKRDTWDLNETITSGATINDASVDAVGRMVQVTFTITFQVNKRTITDSVTTATLVVN